jgi:hypothetical protein
VAGLHGKHTYPAFFGGVSAVPATQFVAANGFPNGYWGWGAEDDALLARLARSGAPRPFGRNPEAGSYGEVAHNAAPPNPLNTAQLALDGERWREDGLAQVDGAGVVAATALCGNAVPATWLRVTTS